MASIHEAAKAGDTDEVRRLLDGGANANARDEISGTPLHAAAQEGHTETCALLLERGADVNAKAKRGTTSLHAAAEEGQSETADLLREDGGGQRVRAFPLSPAMCAGFSRAGAACMTWPAI